MEYIIIQMLHSEEQDELEFPDGKNFFKKKLRYFTFYLAFLNH